MGQNQLAIIQYEVWVLKGMDLVLCTYVTV